MSSKVKIAARLRPRLQGEVDDGGLQVIHATDGSGSYISVPNPRDVSQVFKFPFTSCYDEHAAQEEIFEKDVRPLIDIVYTGVTVTIFAYGVTSSGKTHTMQGTKELPGVIPRVVEAMFAHRASHDLTNISLNMSYFEIHKDEVYDLLVNRADAPKLPVRENDVGQVFVANLSSEPVASSADFNTLFSRANKQRSVGSTNLNNQSSRSHAILTIEVHMPDEAAGRLVTGKINLVDLAGSENNKLTGNDPSRMAESAAINKSLSVLGQVVHALNTGASRIPYRNSKLTRILQDALGGQSVGLLICNLAPSMKFRQDTLNTLNFAVRTKNVENRPVVNEKDTRPAPKPHFAAIAVKPSRGPAANIPALAHGPLPPVPMPAATREHEEPSPLAPLPVAANGRGSVRGRRPSLLPQPIPRPPSAATINPLHRTSGGSSLIGIGISDADVDEKIKRLVEAEVNRRMEDIMERQRGEKERQRALQAAREREAEQAIGSASTTISAGSTVASSSNRSRTLEDASQILDQAPPYVQDEEVEPQRTEAVKAEDELLPARTVSPILTKMDPDMDSKLVSKLEEVEREVTREAKEVDIASQLSPTSRKRTGRAYVAQARAHSNKGDLAAALEFYQKAEKYVPDNVKLKERIIEIEWCIREGKPFDQAPSASDGKKAKSGKKTRSSTSKTSAANSGRATPAEEEDPANDEEAKMDVEASASPPRRRSKGKNKVRDEAKAETPEPPTFGADMTNGNSPGKRPRGDETPVAKVEDGATGTPERPAQKRTRTSRKKASEVKVEVDESEEESEVVGPRRSKRAAGRVKVEA